MIRMPRYTIQEIAALTLEHLREVGWTQGPRSPSGALCVMNATLNAGVHYLDDRTAFNRALGKHTGYRDGILWNDAPETTWADVERVLTDLAKE